MKVFIVEDSELMRIHLYSMVGEIPGVSVAGYAIDEATAIRRIDTLRPEVVILDLSLAEGSGIAVLEHVKARHPAIRVMVLTNYTDDFYQERCKRAGADYFFDKTFQFMKVGAALWQIANQQRGDAPAAA